MLRAGAQKKRYSQNVNKTKEDSKVWKSRLAQFQNSILRDSGTVSEFHLYSGLTRVDSPAETAGCILMVSCMFPSNNVFILHKGKRPYSMFCLFVSLYSLFCLAIYYVFPLRVPVPVSLP